MNIATGMEGKKPTSGPGESCPDWLESLLKAQALAEVMEGADERFTQAVLQALPAHVVRPTPWPWWVQWAACVAGHSHLGPWMVLGAVFGLMAQGLAGGMPIAHELTAMASQPIAQATWLPAILTALLLWGWLQGRRWLE
jgi:hypothetical protein